MDRTKIQLIVTCIILLFSNLVYSQGKVYFSDVVLDKVFVSNMDGSEVTPVLQSSRIFYQKIDAIEEKIYASDNGRGVLVRFDLDGSNEEILVSGLMDARGIAVDESTIFVCDGNEIYSYDKSGNFNEILLEDLDYNVRGLEVNGDFLYVAGQKNFDGRIEKFTKDGSFIDRILDDISSPIHMQIDGDTNRIYWSQYTGSDNGSGLYSATLEGEDLIRHLDFTIRGFDIDFETKDVYWIRSNTGFTLYYSNFDNLEDRELIVNNINNPTSVLIDKLNSRVILSCLHFDFRLVSYDITTGGNRQVMHSAIVSNPEKMSIDENNGYLYWINANSSFSGDQTQAILRCDLDGENIVKLLDNSDGLERPSDILYNEIDGYLYWVDSRKSALKRINTAGASEPEDVFTIEDANLITFDTDGTSGVYYLFDWNSYSIVSKNVKTGEQKTILDTEGKYLYSVEKGRDKLFLTGLNQGSIVSCDLDGTNLDTILTTENSVFHRPTALSYDKKEDRLYFTISFSGEKIQSCNPDGSDVITIVPDGLEAPDGIVVFGDNLSSIKSHDTQNAFLKISPNPSSNFINIESSSALKELIIYSQLGEIMIRLHGDINNIIDVSNLITGTYHLRAFTKNGIMMSDSFVKV